MTDDILLENGNGVRIMRGEKHCGHHFADNAACCCGERLLVAPGAFKADHVNGDPVMVCTDHGVHSYRFSSLVPGWQPSHPVEEREKIPDVDEPQNSEEKMKYAVTMTERRDGKHVEETVDADRVECLNCGALVFYKDHAAVKIFAPGTWSKSERKPSEC